VIVKFIKNKMQSAAAQLQFELLECEHNGEQAGQKVVTTFNVK